NDGWPDLYVSNDYISPDRFYINNRDGTFRELGNDVIRASSMFSMGMDFGDVNNDGHLDYITTDMVSGDRVRRQVQLIEVLGNPTARDAEAGTPTQVRRNTLNIANGDGTYNEIGQYAGVAATEWTWAVRFIDVDLDGFQDLLVANGFVDDAMNADLQEQLTALQERNDRPGVRKAILERPQLPTANVAFRNSGHLRFDDVSEEWGFAHEGISVGMALADFDGDGDLDVAVNNTNAPASLYRNNATAHRLKVSLVGQASNRLGVGGAIRLTTPAGSQFRELGTSGGYLSGSEAVAVFGLGPATTVGPLTVDWPSGDRTVIDQVAADAHLVLAEADPIATRTAEATPAPPQFEEVAAALGAAYRHRESVSDDYGRQLLLPYSLSRFGPGVAWGDLDGDGFDDLYVAAGRKSDSGVFKNVDGQGFEMLPPPGRPADRMEEQAPLWWPRPDGAADVVVSLGAQETHSQPPYGVLRRVANEAGDLVAGGALLASPSSAGALAAADYNGDGFLDLFVAGRARPGAYPLPAASHLMRGGPGGALTEAPDDAPDLADIGLVTGALWSDVDGDGDSDLVLATDWGPLRLLENDGGRLRDATVGAGLAPATGWWSGIAAGDVDHDGDPDLVATNIGTNTRHRAREGEPLVLYAGDFDGDGQMDILETEWDGGRLYATRNRREVGDEIEGLFGRVTSYEDFARTPVEDLLGPEAMAGAVRLEANWLEHALFINEGGGHFAPPKALPSPAQLMAGFGVTIADLDDDGHEDVFMVGNFMGAESAATGPMVGGIGVWLRGDGTGAFEAVPIADSGLSVPGDAKGLAATDLDHDGWVDLAVGVNDGPLMLFHNRGIGGRSGLTIRLVGSPGNPGAVGALVQVTRSDGLVLSREVRAGSSFLSQDSGLQVFGLGETTGPVDVTVAWPDGRTQRLQSLQPRRLLEIRQESQP
ncbi:MAG: FG-GAP-like repeat-containing protein, partial [Anaerolineae bacterium]